MGDPSTHNVLKLFFIIHFFDILCDNYLSLFLSGYDMYDSKIVHMKNVKNILRVKFTL